MPRQNNIQFRKGTGSEWTSANSVLASGEPGYETDTGKLKIGYGGSGWNSLYYTAIHPTGLLAGSNIGVALGTNGSYATISVTGTVDQAEQSQSLVTTVFNETGASIPKMTAVYINGGHGDRPTIQKAIATGDTTSAGTYGLTYEAIGINQTGTVIVFGSLSGLDTDQFNPNAPQGNVNGVTLYLSPTTSGGLTTTKPYAPNHIVAIGTITRTHQNEGVIEVRVQNGFELEELHNVAVTGATNGQFLQYNSGSGLWVPSSSGNFSSLSVNNTGVVVSVGGSNGYLSRFTSSNAIDISSIYQEFANKIRIGNSGIGYVVISDDAWGGELGILTELDEVIAIKYQDGSFRYGGGGVGLENIVVASGGNVGIGTEFPAEKLTVNGNGNFTGSLTVGGNLTVNGTTVTANVDTMTIEDPIITLGLASGNIVTNNTLDRGLALVRATGLTAFMGWDTSASQFVMLSSGVASNSSGNYSAGTYGDLQIRNLTSSTGNFAELSVNNYIDIISSGTSNPNIIRFNDSSTPNSPSLGSVSNGTRLLLSSNDSLGHNAIGVDYGGGGNNNTWFSVPSGMGFKFYNGSNSIFDLGESQLSYNSNFIVDSNGNVNSATWNASTIAVNKGGTGRTSYSNGQLLIGSGTSLVANTLTAGTGISVTNGSGTITINSSLNNPVTGTGVANHVAYWNSSSGIVADSGQLYWDSTNDRLGIGTTSPSYTLDVSGTIGVSGIARFNNDIYMLDTTKRISWDNGTEYIGRQGDSIIIGTQGANRILVNSTGGVGIGTDSPGATLDVRGSAIFNEAGVDADFRIEGDTDTNLVFVDASTDRVGIGTSTPSDKLNIVGNISAGTLSNTQGKFIAYGSASQPNLLFEGFGTDGTARISTNSGANRQLKIENDGASNTLGVYIEGDVGIGTTTPGYKLQVAGSFGATTKSFRIDHPSKKGYSLEYGSLESPYHGVRLTGRGKVIKGVGTVDLPDYLKDLIHDDESIVIQLTNYKHGKTLYVSNIDLQNDKFIVKADRAKSFGELEFFWTLTGVRKDVEDLVVEKRN